MHAIYCWQLLQLSLLSAPWKGGGCEDPWRCQNLRNPEVRFLRVGKSNQQLANDFSWYQMFGFLWEGSFPNSWMDPVPFPASCLVLEMGRSTKTWRWSYGRWFNRSNWLTPCSWPHCNSMNHPLLDAAAFCGNSSSSLWMIQHPVVSWPQIHYEWLTFQKAEMTGLFIYYNLLYY